MLNATVEHSRSGTAKTETVISEPVMNESKEQKKSLTTLNPLIDKAIKSSHETQEYIHEAAMGCLSHYKEFGDARPMDRLVKGVAKEHQQPLILWVKSNAPIWWNAKSEVKVRDKDDEKYVPLNMKAAEKTPYMKTAEANARNNKTLEPFTAKTIIDRVKNLKRQLENVTKDDSKREFDDSFGSEKLANQMIDTLIEVLEPFEDKIERANKAAIRKMRDLKEAETNNKIVNRRRPVAVADTKTAKITDKQAA